MSTEILGIENGIFQIRIGGKLTHEEMVAAQKQLIGLPEGAQIPVLVDARKFEGWATEGDWSNFDTQYQAEPRIRRMAIVAEASWETLIAAFTGKGLRSFPIEIFAPEDFDKAVAWATAQ